MSNLTLHGIESFIQSGSYHELKQLEEKVRVLKSMIRDEQATLRSIVHALLKNVINT
jgi:hypothetical protein